MVVIIKAKERERERETEGEVEPILFDHLYAQPCCTFECI